MILQYEFHVGAYWIIRRRKDEDMLCIEL
jgi:hypothetical protein